MSLLYYPSESWMEKWWQSACVPVPLPKQVRRSKHSMLVPVIISGCSSSNDKTKGLLIGVEVFRVWFHTIPKVTGAQGVTKRSVSLCPVHPCPRVSPAPLGSRLGIVRQQLLAQHADLVAQLLIQHKESVRRAWPGTG